MVRELDSFIVVKLQSLCDAFQAITGLTKYRLEKWSAIAILILLAIATVLDPKYQVIFTSGSATTFLGLIVLFGIWDIHRIDQKEAVFLATGTPVYEPLAESWRYRVACLTFYVAWFLPVSGTPGDWSVFLAAVSDLLRQYLQACVPRPPGKSKVREWAAKALEHLSSLLPPAPEPQAAGS